MFALFLVGEIASAQNISTSLTQNSLDSSSIQKTSSSLSEKISSTLKRMNFGDFQNDIPLQPWTTPSMLDQFVDDSHLLGDYRLETNILDENVREKFNLDAEEVRQHKFLTARSEYAYKNHLRREEELAHLRDKHKIAKDFRREKTLAALDAKRKKLNARAAEKIQMAYQASDQKKNELIAETKLQAQQMIEDSPALIDVAKEDYSRSKNKESLTPKMNRLRDVELLRLQDYRRAAEKRRRLLRALRHSELRWKHAENRARQNVLNQYDDNLNEMTAQVKKDQRLAREDNDKQKEMVLTQRREKAQIVAEKMQGENKIKGFEYLDQQLKQALSQADENLKTRLNEIDARTKALYQKLGEDKKIALEKIDERQRNNDHRVEVRRGEIDEDYQLAKIQAQNRKRVLARMSVDQKKMRTILDTSSSEALTLADVDRILKAHLADEDWLKQQKVRSAEQQRARSHRWLDERSPAWLMKSVTNDKQGLYHIPFVNQVREHEEATLDDLKHFEPMIDGNEKN